MSDFSEKTTKLGDLLNPKNRNQNESKNNNQSKKHKNQIKTKNITDQPGYYAQKMREFRKRAYQKDKSIWKKYLYAVEINGKKYCFLSPRDVKIERVEKKLVNQDKDQEVFVKVF